MSKISRVRRARFLALLAAALAVAGAAYIYFHARSEEPSPGPLPAEKRIFPRRDLEALLSWSHAADGRRRVAGTVASATAREPAIGAVVKLTAARPIDKEQEKTATTDEQGAFDFGEQPLGRYIVGASAPGFVTAVIEIDTSDKNADTEHIELVLRRCEARLSGKVVDTSRNAIGGAKLAWREATGPVLAESDASGAFSVCVNPGYTPLVVGAPGYGTIASHLFVEGETRHTFVLRPEAVLYGSVVMREGRAPVAGAVVWVEPVEALDGEGGRVVAVSDREGKFHIEGLSEGIHRAQARTRSSLSSQPVVVTLASGQTTGPIVIEIEPGVKIVGRVLEGGRPLAAARVSALARDGRARSTGARTNDEGRFTIEDAPSGWVRFDVEGFKVVSPPSVDTASVRGREVEIEVAAVGTIRGVVVRDGEPAGEGIVVMGGANTAITTADGRFEIARVPLGRHRIYAIGVDGEPSREVGVNLLTPGEVKEITLSLDGGPRISGRVLDTRRAPVAGATVVAQTTDGRDVAMTTSEPDGGFDLFGLAGAGTVRLTALSSYDVPYRPVGGRWPEVSIPSARTRLQVDIVVESDDARIAGRVIDERGKARSDIRVRALRAAEATGAYVLVAAQAHTDLDGRFALAPLLPGAYGVEAQAGNGERVFVEGVAAGTDDLVLRLAPAAAIRGRLVGFDEPPTVLAAREDLAWTSHQGVVSGDRFELLGLAAGRYVLTARGGGAEATARVEARPGLDTEVVLDAGETGSLEGRIIEFYDGNAVPHAECTASLAQMDAALFHDAPPAARAVSDERGNFEMPRAPSGDVALWCRVARHRGLMSAPFHLQLATKEARAVDVFFVRPRHEPGGKGVGLVVDTTTGTAVVTAVDPEGPGARAGVRAGDVIIAIDGRGVENRPGLDTLAVLVDRPVGETARVELRREGASATVAADVIIERDDDAALFPAP